MTHKPVTVRYCFWYLMLTITNNPSHNHHQFNSILSSKPSPPNVQTLKFLLRFLSDLLLNQRRRYLSLLRQVKDGTSLETGIRQTLKAQLPKNHELLRCSDKVSLTQLFKATSVVQEDELTDIEDGIDIPPIGSQKFETLDMGSASGDVEEDVDESGVEVRDVELAMKLARVSRPIAVKTLKTRKKKTIGAIFHLTELENVISESLITLRHSLKPSSELIQQDALLVEETKKHPLIQEETKLKHELVKIIRSGQTKTLSPNSDKCTKIGNQHIYVRNYMEPESDYCIWEWYGNIKVAFDDNSEFKTEFYSWNLQGECESWFG